MGFPPRARGCTYLEQPLELGALVPPARAGMHLVLRNPKWAVPSLCPARAGMHPAPRGSVAFRRASAASVDGSNPAISGHRKAGHFRRPETAREFYFMGSRTRKDLSLVKPGPPGP